jgi:class 3 adenylate cyclase
MFCDLVGSTALSRRLDPEDLREVIGASPLRGGGGSTFRRLHRQIHVYFGYPQAHEDDAERAVRAGLGSVEAVGGLDTHAIGRLQVRIGIATGLVVVGDLVGEGASQRCPIPDNHAARRG